MDAREIARKRNLELTDKKTLFLMFFAKKIQFSLNIPAMFGIITIAIDMAV